MLAGRRGACGRARLLPSPLGIVTELEVRLPDSGGTSHSYDLLRTSILGVALADIQVRALSGSAGASPSQKTCQKNKLLRCCHVVGLWPKAALSLYDLRELCGLSCWLAAKDKFQFAWILQAIGQLVQGFGLNLSHAFTCETQLFANLLQRVRLPVLQAKAHP